MSTSSLPGMSQPLPSVLVIDDDAAFNAILMRSLGRRGYPVRGAHSPDEALALARQAVPDWVVLDLNLAGASGMALIPPLLALAPAPRIVVLTGYASIATAVDAIKLGAVQYLAKPVELSALIAAFGDAPARADAQEPPDDPLSVDRLTWEHIQRVLAEHEGNISATARALKMHRRTLQRRLGKRPARA